MKLPKRGRLAWVAWDDAAGSATWGQDPKAPRLVRCWRVGYLVHIGKRRIVLAAGHCPSGKGLPFSGRFTVPRESIVEIRRAYVGKRR